jgi:hypothetical protein
MNEFFLSADVAVSVNCAVAFEIEIQIVFCTYSRICCLLEAHQSAQAMRCEKLAATVTAADG